MRFNFTTLPQLRREMRDRSRNETGVRRLKAAKWLDANCNDTQLGNVFNLALPADITALRTRLQTKAAKLDALIAAQQAVDAQAGE